MERFYEVMVRILPSLRTRLSYGIALLLVLSFLFIHMQPNTPVIPQIFIFAVVPLLIAMVLIGRSLTPGYQFVLIFTITLMCLAFLGTGVALAKADQTSKKEVQYASEIYPLEVTLNKRYLKDIEQEIYAVENYSGYRDLIIGIYAKDNSEEMRSGLEKIVNFYQDYISCRSELQCFGSPQFDGRIRDFWYTFRPIIEERRTGLWDPDFASSLQNYAEAVRRPVYLSKVKVNPVTGKTSLVRVEPINSWKDRLPSLIHKWL